MLGTSVARQTWSRADRQGLQSKAARILKGSNWLVQPEFSRIIQTKEKDLIGWLKTSAFYGCFNTNKKKNFFTHYFWPIQIILWVKSEICIYVGKLKYLLRFLHTFFMWQKKSWIFSWSFPSDLRNWKMMWRVSRAIRRHSKSPKCQDPNRIWFKNVFSRLLVAFAMQFRLQSRFAYHLPGAFGPYLNFGFAFFFCIHSGLNLWQFVGPETHWASSSQHVRLFVYGLLLLFCV